MEGLICYLLLHSDEQTGMVLNFRFASSNSLLEWQVSFLDNFEFQTDVALELLQLLVPVCIIFNFVGLSIDPILNIAQLLTCVSIGLF